MGTNLREVERSIIHVDADAFFASVEQRDNPEYRGKPVIVGHDPKGRGVVSTCSYEARAFGIRSAMPMAVAYRLCPHGIFVRPRMERYAEVSRAMFSIIERYSPLIEEVSIDEAYLDVSGEDGREIALCIKRDVVKELGITVTAGVSYCKFLAKLASDAAKPDGLLVISRDDAAAFLEGLPVSRIPGIGPKTAAKLDKWGIRTVYDLKKMPPEWFESTFGKSGSRILALCQGQDDEPVAPSREVKSISEETTFAEDVPSKVSLYPHLALLCQDVGFRLRRSGLKARVLGIKVKFSDFSVSTREVTLPEAVSTDHAFYTTLKSLLDRMKLPKPVRLLGVFARGLQTDDPRQPLLLSSGPDQWEVLCRSLDQLRLKYGKPLVRLGASISARATGEAPASLDGIAKS
ncbi:MAG: DNA polymerase IV [Firmicutes bacterium]|nr:DNA polymerase IV [Candidatus Fermentithermobacillaceae bacterium]